MKIFFTNKFKRSNLPFRFITTLVLCLLIRAAFAQSTAELLGAAPGGGPSGSGPTTAAQTVTFYTTTSSALSPALTATYTLSNQQFASTEGNPTVPGTTFGANIQLTTNGSTAANLPLATAAYSLMNGISGNTAASINPYYTACSTCGAGTGVDIATNRSIWLLNSSDALINSSGVSTYSLSGRHQFSDLTITFNRPVNNPVVHFTGLGGFFEYDSPAGTNFYSIGFSTEADLITPGLTWTKLSGNSVMNVTSTQVTNTATRMGTATLGSTVSGVSRQAASGSVRVNGTGITSFTMRLYLHGDGGVIHNSAGTTTSAAFGNVVQWSSQQNLTPGGGGSAYFNGFCGDGFLIGLSMEEPPVCTNPTITTQPTATTACTGNTMTVAATGTGLIYQWEYSSNGVTSLGNAGQVGNNTATMTVGGSSTPQYFRAKVSDGSCVTYSNWALLSACPPVLSASDPAAQTATTGQSKSGNAATELLPTGGTGPYVYSNGSSDPACTAVAGATALPVSSNLTVNSSTGDYTYTAPATAGTYYFCIKVCDSATPTAACVVKTYTVTVTASAATICTTTPTIIKN